jgi:hypothetical protein
MSPARGMFMNTVVEINTDEELLARLKTKSDHRQSPEDAKEQRVSFVYGAMKSDSSITKEAVRRIIAKQEG